MEKIIKIKIEKEYDEFLKKHSDDNLELITLIENTEIDDD